MLHILRADYSLPAHAEALIERLDHDARDPAGGGAPLSDYVRTHLVSELVARPFMFSVLAFDADQPVGLINAIEGFSTFACKPLINIHDVIVSNSHRGQGVAKAMFAEIEAIARARGACKLTLEVLHGNTGARKLYETLGFDDYRLAPALGEARFMQKWLD